MHGYIHVPYCAAKCPYCDFNSIAGRDFEFSQYVKALLQEIRGWPKGPYHTLFIGGGTPSILPPAWLAQLCAGIRQHCQLSENYEWTCEANPGSVDQERFAVLAEHGVNRLSLGVQSVHDHHLRFLGRVHTADEAERAVELAQRFFPRVSCDLMVGLPGQSDEELAVELAWYRRHHLRHASVYHLAIEVGTEFHARRSRGDLHEIDDERSAQVLMMVAAALTDLGMVAYETSNYAQIGEECRHNLAYWTQADYQAAGAGAVSTLGTVRSTREPHPGRYIAAISAGQDAIWRREHLSPAEVLNECWMLGLRLSTGVQRKHLAAHHDPAQRWQPLVDELQAQGLVIADDHSIRLTAAGRRVQDAVTVRLMP